MIRIYKDPHHSQWCVLDDWGWSVLWFNKPSKARKARHLYRAYLSAKTDKESNHIITLVKQLGETS